MIRGRKESSRKFTCNQRTLQMAAFPRYVVLVFLLLGAVVAVVDAAEAAKSAFGEAFDEIVVESTLTVRGKTPGRQSRNRAIAVETSTVGTSTAAAVAANVGEVKRSKRQHLEPHGPRIDTEDHNKLHGASQTYTTLLRSGFPAAAATVSLSRSGFGLDPGATSRGSHGKGASSGAASVIITDHNGNTRNYYG